MIKLGTLYIVFEDVITEDEFFNLNRNIKKETGCCLEVKNYINPPNEPNTMMSATLGVHLKNKSIYEKYESSNILTMNCVIAIIKKWHIHNYRKVDVMILNVNPTKSE